MKRYKIKIGNLLFVPFALFWLIAILPKHVQLLIFLSVFWAVGSKRYMSIKYDYFVVIQIVCSLLMFFSIFINSWVDQHETSRIFAAINTAIIGFVSCWMYVFVSNMSKMKTDVIMKKLCTYALGNMLVLIFIFVLYKFSDVLNNIVVLGHTVSSDDWINGNYQERFLGFLDYSNMVIFATLLFYPLALKKIQKNKFLSFFFTLSVFAVVKATNSRSGLVLFCLLGISAIILNVSKKFREFVNNNRILTIFLIALVAVLLYSAFGDRINEIFNSLISMRTGSNNMRLYIYAESLSRMISNSPIIGIGIKDMIGNSGYPYGSHSSYIGMFYKIGLIGGMLYVTSMIYLFFLIIKAKPYDTASTVMKISLCMIMALMLLEDIDGTDWCIFIFYLVTALFLVKCGKYKVINNYENLIEHKSEM